jgi:endonuclease YncB( thermonuclease family)
MNLSFSNHPDSFPVWTERRAYGVRAIDGDTLVVLLDCGHRVRLEAEIRLLGISTPELVGTSGPELELARKAKARVEELCIGKPLSIHTWKDRRSFTRWLGKVFYWNSEKEIWMNLEETLLKEGLAVNDGS